MNIPSISKIPSINIYYVVNHKLKTYYVGYTSKSSTYGLKSALYLLGKNTHPNKALQADYSEFPGDFTAGLGSMWGPTGGPWVPGAPKAPGPPGPYKIYNAKNTVNFLGVSHEDIASQIDIVDTHWVWQGRISKGYPEIQRRVEGKTLNISASRASYYLANGDFTGRILHGCNNKLCVNPKHLTCGGPK